jgi:hypothetical protein
MNGESDHDRPRPARRTVGGPSPIGALVPRIARAAFARTAPGTAQIMEAWPAIVGPALAAVTMPRRLSRGTLTIGCSGPVAMELQHLSTELLERVNRYLGGQTVQRLSFIQTFARAAAVPGRARAPVAPPVELAAAAAVAHLPDGPLKEALAALGRAVLTETASRLGRQLHTRT